MCFKQRCEVHLILNDTVLPKYRVWKNAQGRVIQSKIIKLNVEFMQITLVKGKKVNKSDVATVFWRFCPQAFKGDSMVRDEGRPEIS